MLKRTMLIGLILSCGLLAGLVLTGRMRSASESTAVPAPEGTAAPPAPAAAVPASAVDFTEIAAQTVNAVTNISSLTITRLPNSPFANDPFFHYFFGDDEDMFGYRSRREASLGSGVIVSPDGYVLTNNHVIGERASEISVALADKREIRAKVVGTDPWTDVALLKINLRNLPVLPWGDSSRLKVAEWVLAIGNPFQLNQTVTLGIISAVGRANIGIATYEDFIQTDAAINPGNSGGALINARGELVGINTAIYSESGGYQGVGFAVPSNLARRVMADLVTYGEVQRGSIGLVEIAPLTTEQAQDLGAPTTRGALVTRMRRDSEAYRAGIRPGDIIVAFNGHAVDDASQFLRMLSDAKIGTRAKVTVLREARRRDVTVEILRGSRTRRRPVL
ncbi:MAG: trypsin-like peptidase domain-containing protein [Acidobacteria bacterium]|nr:trypsin-like peptidase domain-containing protein [Acidobacteriota bacterium]